MKQPLGWIPRSWASVHSVSGRLQRQGLPLLYRDRETLAAIRTIGDFSMMPLPTMMAVPPSDRTTQQHAALHKAAQQLEAQFLAEMLKSTSVVAGESAFGGGTGEEQFQSFLHQAQADRMVEGGGIGLAESIFAALTRRVAG
ncbi:rod-binding protein [Fluviibacterium sp. S390]|uniref:rod-binding protein n=1 Tax=Fluviibacterium sp. S390 TaxID=3415139 RepID=UPI003C7B33B1